MPPVLARRLTLAEAGVRCAEMAWDTSHFSADQDWVPMTNGKDATGDTLWRWVSMGSSTGHLQNKRTGGHLNFRPGGFVRGHGNENRPPRRPARAGESTALERASIDFGHQKEGYPCAIGSVYNFRFRTRGGGMLSVEQDGTLAATRRFCTDDASCLFSMQESPEHPGWVLVRSVLTGGLLRMVGEEHPSFDGWDGVVRPKAAAKTPDALHNQATRAANLQHATCPLRSHVSLDLRFSSHCPASLHMHWLWISRHIYERLFHCDLSVISV